MTRAQQIKYAIYFLTNNPEVLDNLVTRAYYMGKLSDKRPHGLDSEIWAKGYRMLKANPALDKNPKIC